MTINVKQVLLAAMMTVVVAIFSHFFLVWLGPDWSVYAPATCTLTRCFCEAPRTDMLILQPSNSWSSLGFAFAGILMIILARSPRWSSGLLPSAATIFGISAIIVGIGSVLLHATLTLWGQFADVFGMYLVGGFMLTSALAKWLGFSHRRSAITYVMLCAALVAVLYLSPETRRWLFAVILLAAIIVEIAFARIRRPSVKFGYFVAGMLTNALAFLIWNLDQNGALCDPTSWVQGHAVWHLLGAVALWFSFLYYVSEKRA